VQSAEINWRRWRHCCYVHFLFERAIYGGRGRIRETLNANGAAGVAMRQYRIKMNINIFRSAAFSSSSSSSITSSCVNNISSNCCCCCCCTPIIYDFKTCRISRTLTLIQHAFQTTPNNRHHWGYRQCTLVCWDKCAMY